MRLGQGGSRLERAAAGSPLTNGVADNRVWYLGGFYVNRDDPSIFVEKRFGIGYTINFGNPKAVALFLVFLAIVLTVVVSGLLIAADPHASCSLTMRRGAAACRARRRRFHVPPCTALLRHPAGRVTAPAAAQFPAAGRWEGAIEIMGQQLNIVVDIAGAAAAPKATIDIPQQGAKGIALVNVRINEQLVHFELPAGPGLATFEGVLRGDAIAGTFTQAGMKGTFELKKGRPPRRKRLRPTKRKR